MREWSGQVSPHQKYSSRTLTRHVVRRQSDSGDGAFARIQAAKSICTSLRTSGAAFPSPAVPSPGSINPWIQKSSNPFRVFRFPAFPPFAFNHGNSFVSSLCCSKKVFGLRPSDFFRASDFGLRILSVSICVWCRSSALWLKNIRVNWRTFADHPCSVVRPCLGPAIRSVVGNPRFRFLGEPLRPPRLCVCRWPDHLLNWCQFAQFA